MKQTPFFVVGCGRSGTTLLRKMLNNHSKLAIPLESLFIIDYFLAESSIPLSKLKKLLVKEYELKEWGIKVFEEDLMECNSVSEMIRKVHEIYQKKHNKLIWGQKTPRFVRFGSLLKEAYPNAKFIHLIRDPRAVVNSLMQSDVHQSNVLFATKRWLQDVTQGLSLRRKLGEDVLEIRYESLILEPQESLLRIVDFLGIDFEEDMLNYQKSGEKEYGEYYTKINQKLTAPLDKDRINAWRNKLSDRDIALIEYFCGPLMLELGYDSIKGETSAIVSNTYIGYLKGERVIGLIKQMMLYLGKRPQYLFCTLQRKWKLKLLFRDLNKVNY